MRSTLKVWDATGGEENESRAMPRSGLSGKTWRLKKQDYTHTSNRTWVENDMLSLKKSHREITFISGGGMGMLHLTGKREALENFLVAIQAEL